MCGSACTRCCSRSCARPTGSTGRGRRSTVRMCAPLGGREDRSKPGRPRQKRLQAPYGHLRRRHAAGALLEQRQPQRRPRTAPAARRDPARARQARPPAQATEAAARRRRLQLAPPPPRTPHRWDRGRDPTAQECTRLRAWQAALGAFSSIEEYLGTKANTRTYYDVLSELGQGSWHPERDARPWVRFCLTAHFRQAKTVVRRIEQAERLWMLVAELVSERGLPERTIGRLSARRPLDVG